MAPLCPLKLYAFRVFFYKFFIFNYARNKAKLEIITSLISNLQSLYPFIQICPLTNSGGILITIEVVVNLINQ